MTSSHVVWEAGRVSRELHSLLKSGSFCANSKICRAMGLSTGKIPSTKPDPYFHPRPLKEPPVQRRWIKNLKISMFKTHDMSIKLCVTSFPRQLLGIKASQFALFVNIKTFTFALLNSLTTWILRLASETTLIASWFYEYIIQYAISDQPTKLIQLSLFHIFF